MKKQKKNYLDNDDLISEIMISRKYQKITKNLHFMLFDLSTRISNKKNWSGYSWKEDMIMKAYIKCLNAVWKIDINRKSLNAFAYFTTIVNFSNIDYIKYEKRQSDFKKIAFDKYMEMLKCEFNIVDTRNNFNNWDI